VATLRPDVVAVQEVEPIDHQLLFAGDCQPTFRDRASDLEYAKRGIGVFSYTDLALKAADSANTLGGFRRFEAQRNGLSFNVVAVWTAAPKYGQANEGIEKYRTWMQQRPTIMLGDFNKSASFSEKGWRPLMDLVEELGLGSAYHHFFREPFGAETRATHFHQRKEDRPFHIDYCFLPQGWLSAIENVQVGEYAEWQMDSDHVPIVVDLKL
jgi:endonuclease/exonuclease/phosphatase family metal-dependent hydrolase